MKKVDFIIFVDGSQRWYLNGKLHREDGPAVISANGQFWFFNDYLHRENGPARVLANGYKEWYINGRYVKEERPNEED